MKEILIRLIWKFLGYGCCRPLHSHEVQAILEKYHKSSHDNMMAQLSDQRAQLFEFMRQQQEAEAHKIVSVRIVE